MPGLRPVAILVHETSLCGGLLISKCEYLFALTNLFKLGNRPCPFKLSKIVGSNASRPRRIVFILFNYGAKVRKSYGKSLEAEGEVGHFQTPQLAQYSAVQEWNRMEWLPR